MSTLNAKELVLKAGIELVNTGLIVRTWGNVSCRIDDNIFAITPSGLEYSKLTQNEIVEVRIDDESYLGQTKPSSEKSMHAAVYKIFPSINFIIHTHQEKASVLSATGLNTIDLGSEYEDIGDQVICAKYALPETKLLSKHSIEALKRSKGNAILLKHHGVLSVGEDYTQAFRVIHRLEQACENFLNDKKIELGEELIDYKGNDNSEIFQSLSPESGCFLLNTCPEVMHFSHTELELRPFLDDFAQIVGIKANTVENKMDQIKKALKHSSAVFIKGVGALCWGKDQKDALAVSMITEKNCKAYFAAKLFGKPKPIKNIECRYMRYNYLKRYSKLAK